MNSKVRKVRHTTNTEETKMYDLISFFGDLRGLTIVVKTYISPTLGVDKIETEFSYQKVKDVVVKAEEWLNE